MANACKYVLLACLLGTGVAQAQQFRFGVRGGLTLTKPTSTYDQRDESKRYLIGPVLELRWSRVALDVSLLYQRAGTTYFSTFTGPPESPLEGFQQTTVRSRANVWQLPIVGKYFFRRSGSWQPFVGAGYALQTAWTTTTSSSILINQGQQQVLNDEMTSTRSSNGAVAAVGVQFLRGRFAITPEFRYIRWVGTFKPNQVQATVGLTF
jgi:hypothetical protein